MGKPGHRFLFKDREPPRPGSMVRAVYDLALAGRAIDRRDLAERFGASCSNIGVAFTQLRDYHGFEFEKEERGVWRAVGRFHATGRYERIYPSN